MDKFKFITLFNLKGVPVKIHWSLSIILFLALIAGIFEFSLIVGAISFWSIMLIHELGHMWFASRLGLDTLKIELYPIHGVCHSLSADNDYHNSLVAWGGVAAQAVIFVPCMFIFSLYGENLSWYINTPLIFLGYISAGIALFNLAPTKGFDGNTCWRAIPLYLKYRKPQEKEKPKKNHLKSVK